MGNTTIAVTQETKKALQQLGTKGEPYDSIIKKIAQSKRLEETR